MTVSCTMPRNVFLTAVRRFAYCYDGVTHEIHHFSFDTASVAFLCDPRSAVLVDPQTRVHDYSCDELTVDCMTCLVHGASV